MVVGVCVVVVVCWAFLSGVVFRGSWRLVLRLLGGFVRCIGCGRGRSRILVCCRVGCCRWGSFLGLCWRVLLALVRCVLSWFYFSGGLWFCQLFV